MNDRFYKRLEERLLKFGLELAKDKIRVMPFSRYRQGRDELRVSGFRVSLGCESSEKFAALLWGNIFSISFASGIVGGRVLLFLQRPYLIVPMFLPPFLFPSQQHR